MAPPPVLSAVRRSRGAPHDDGDAAAGGDTLEQGALQLGAAHRDGGHRSRAAAAAQRLRRRQGPPRRLEVGHRDYMVFLIWVVLCNANCSSISSVAYFYNTVLLGVLWQRVR